MGYCGPAALRWFRATGILVDCDEVEVYLEDLPSHLAGYTDGETVTVAAGDPEWVQIIVDHEVGHILAGVGHGHSERGLMQPAPNRLSKITLDDLEWLCESAQCLWEEPE